MDHKYNKNVKYYPNSKEPSPQFKLHGAPSKIESTIFYLAITPRGRVGYEMMIDSQRGA